MTIKIDKNIIEYIIINILLVIDALFLAMLPVNGFSFTIYFIINTLSFSAYCIKSEIKKSLNFILFFLLTYVYTIEILIHNLQIHLYYEAVYLYIIPLIIIFLKNRKKKDNKFLLFLLYIIFNFFILLISDANISITYFFKTFYPFALSLVFFSLFYENKFNNLSMYKTIYIICFIITIIQTIVGFNRDTRNALFGIYGIGCYGMFIMCYPVYICALWLKKKRSIFELLISLACTIVILICTENKACIVLLFISLIIISLFSSKKLLKNIIISGIFVATLPIGFNLMLHYYPKFYYLTSPETIKNYFVGNNNTYFTYGRFEALEYVYKDMSTTQKIFGNGLGSSTQTDEVFITESERRTYEPYYIKRYGDRHGYHLTSLSTIMLDGGYILLIIIFSVLIKIIIEGFYKLRLEDTNEFVKGSIIINSTLVFLFYLIYNNVFNSFKILYTFFIIIGTLLGSSFKIREKSTESS